MRIFIMRNSKFIRHPNREMFIDAQDDIYGPGNSFVTWEKHKGDEIPVKVIDGVKYTIASKCVQMSNGIWVGLEEQFPLEDYLNSHYKIKIDGNGYILVEE